MKSLHLKLPSKGRRGQSTVIGGIFFLLIAVLLTNFLYEVISVQQQMNQFDSERAQERVDISDVLFGNYTLIAKPDLHNVTIGQQVTFNNDENADPYLKANSSWTVGYFNTIENGEFSQDTRGWYFTRQYGSTGISGASGSFTTEVTGSMSGSGAVYFDFLFNPPAGEKARAIITLSRPFIIDFKSIGGAEKITNCTLKLGRKYTIYNNIFNSFLNVTIVKQGGEQHGSSSTYNETITDIDANWVKKEYNFTKFIKTLPVPDTQQYLLKITFNATLKNSATITPEIKMLMDDIEFIVTFKNYILEWDYTFNVNKSPNLIASLETVFQSHYDKDVSQIISVRDQTTEGRYVRLARSSVSTEDVKFRFTFKSSDVQYYLSPTGDISFKIYSIGSEQFSGIYSTPTLSVFSTETQDFIIVSIRNWGGIPITIKNLWIIDSTGHTPWDENHEEIPVSPGSTYVFKENHPWKAGEYLIKIVTKRGTVVRYTTTAY